MDHVKFRYMLELPNYLRVLIHLGLRENLFSRVNQQETIKIFSHNCYLCAAKRRILLFKILFFSFFNEPFVSLKETIRNN